MSLGNLPSSSVIHSFMSCEVVCIEVRVALVITELSGIHALRFKYMTQFSRNKPVLKKRAYSRSLKNMARSCFTNKKIDVVVAISRTGVLEGA